MPRLPTKTEEDARHSEYFAEAFERDAAEQEQFFSELEDAGRFCCSIAGRRAITLASWRYMRGMQTPEQFDDFMRAKRQLEKIRKKTLQGTAVAIVTKEIARFRAMTNWDWSSPVWDDFEVELEREHIIFTFRLWDTRPAAGDGRIRFARACQALLSNFNARFGIRHGSRAKEASRARARKDWVMQIIRTFAQEGGSLTIRNRADGKEGNAVDLVCYLYNALPPYCRHTDIGTVARHDIAPIAQSLRKQSIDLDR